MKSFLIRLLVSCAVYVVIGAQGARPQTPAPFLSQPPQLGKISHENNSATFTVNDPRPMARAVVTLRREYGWLIDYEDPVYSPAELVDFNANPEQIGTKAKHFAKIPAGGPFIASFPEDLATGMDDDQHRHDAFNALLTEYSKSGQPGRFKLLSSGTDRVVVAGTSENKTPLLDTKMSFSANGISAYAAIEQSLHVLQQTVGHHLGLGIVPARSLSLCTVNQSFQDVAARDVILQILDRCNLTLVYQFLYDASIDYFYLNLEAAGKVEYGRQGQRMVTPISPSHN